MGCITNLVATGTALVLSSVSFNTMASNAKLDNQIAVQAFVDGTVNSLMNTFDSPSGAVAIVKDGKLVVGKGFGYQSLRKKIAIDIERTVFRVGSISKLVVTVAIMQMVEQGKLDLDTDVNDYLETFKIEDAHGSPVTLRHILTHTAGFEDKPRSYVVDDIDELLPSLEVLENFQPYRVNPPGAQSAFNSYGTALAGHIIAKLTGSPFNDYVKHQILSPLGMNSSTFEEPLPEPLSKNLAAAYAMGAGEYIELPLQYFSNYGPTNAMSTTIQDLVRFGAAILNRGELNGQRILKPETVDQMLAHNFSQDERLMGMTLGFFETDRNGHRTVGHLGDIRGYHSSIEIDAANNMIIVTAFSNNSGEVLRNEVVSAFYDRYFPRSEDHPVPPDDFSERAERYVGQYGFWRENFSDIDKATGARYSTSVFVTATQNNTLAVSLGAGHTKQYAEVEKNLFREVNSDVSLIYGFTPRLVAFQEDDAGQVTGFIIDQWPMFSLRRMPFYETYSFTEPMLMIVFGIFILVLLRRFYQRSEIRMMEARDRSAILVLVLTAGANLLVVGSWKVLSSTVSLQGSIPVALDFWLVLPIIATMMGLYCAYRTIIVWKNGELVGFLARARYTVVALCSLFMVWFYYYWNILGWQYVD